MRRDPLTAGVAGMGDALKISAGKWLAVSMLMVKLGADLFDHDNRFVASGVGFVQEAAVPPNGAGRFAFFVADADQRAVACRLTVQEAVYR